MLNYDYNDPYSYSSTPGYVDYDSDLVEKPLPSTSTGPIFSPPYQSPYHLRESGPASPFSSQGYSYDSCPLSSCLSPRREPFLPAFSHGLHALHHLLLLPASLLRLPRLLRARRARPPLGPASSLQPCEALAVLRPAPQVLAVLQLLPPRLAGAAQDLSRGRSRHADGEAAVEAELARAEKRKSQRGQRVGHGCCSRRGVACCSGSWSARARRRWLPIYAALGDEVQCLVMDQYGNYLFQKLVDMSSDDQRREVVGDEGRRER